MSKSKPETSVFVHDSPEEIQKKISNAFCPERTVEFNPIMEYCRFIIFRERKTFTIERSVRFGGNVEFTGYSELEDAYLSGKLHPLDLKKAVANVLVEILAPVRKHFETNREARESLEILKKAQITR
jgi:tyrosyl-tRNA synthetase